MTATGVRLNRERGHSRAGGLPIVAVTRTFFVPPILVQLSPASARR